MQCSTAVRADHLYRLLTKEENKSAIVLNYSMQQTYQLVKKFPAFYGTRNFITAFTGARHLSIS